MGSALWHLICFARMKILGKSLRKVSEGNHEARGMWMRKYISVRFSSTSTVRRVKLDSFCLKLFKEGTVNYQLTVSSQLSMQPRRGSGHLRGTRGLQGTVNLPRRAGYRSTTTGQMSAFDSLWVHLTVLNGSSIINCTTKVLDVEGL